MQIRSDLKPIESVLNRLIEYSKMFDEYDLDWSNLKNNEDFRRVYNYEWEIRSPLEEIYSEGRELARGFSSTLIQFNDTGRFPQLKHFIEYFDDTWLFDTKFLRTKLQTAKDICSRLDDTPWAMSKMLILFEKQIEFIPSIKQSVEVLKETEIYRRETGKDSNLNDTVEYNKILSVIHSVGKMFERLPNTYIKKSEEELRDHILVTLTASIPGTATGETYNKSGKTDILIRHDDSNIFIGECKIWHGESAFLEAIDQLLNYLTWRDRDTAIILFVKNQDISNVIRKIKSSVCNHSRYVSQTQDSENRWINCKFKAEKDSNIFNIAMMSYHIV